MALIKIYAEANRLSELRAHVAWSIKLVATAVLNVSDVETTPGHVETVYSEGLDLIGIDYICEIIGVERPNEQEIADDFIRGLNEIYPDKLFSIYFVHIREEGMSSTPRKGTMQEPISIDEAVRLAKSSVGDATGVADKNNNSQEG